MNVIVYANEEWFEEAKNMCEALRELFREELEEDIRPLYNQLLEAAE